MARRSDLHIQTGCSLGAAPEIWRVHPYAAILFPVALGCASRVGLNRGAADGAAALCLALRPDVVVLDQDMPVMKGLEVASALADQLPDAHVLIFGMDEAVAPAARAAGAQFVSKSERSDVLLRSLQLAIDGPVPRENASAARATQPRFAALRALTADAAVLGFGHAA